MNLKVFLSIVGLSIAIANFAEEITTSNSLFLSDSNEFNEATTTSFTQPECFTGNNSSGICSSFQSCYPLLMLQEDNSTHSSLFQELMETSQSPFCENGLICCKTNDQEKGEGYSSDEELSPESFLPKNCGRSPFSGFHLWNMKDQKITGGKNAQQGQFPWMVAIFGKNGKITCGASLISSHFVLTAAHCLLSYSAQDVQRLKLHIGDHNLMSLKDGPHEVRKISQIILHKGFNAQTYHNDIALIKLDREVNFSDKIQPICLPPLGFTNKEIEGKNIIVTGWGRDRQWGKDSSILRMVEMRVWKLEECRRVFNIFAPNRIQEDMNLCAGDGRKNKDACIGDSGGPNFYKMNDSRYYQVGIVSWGKGCGSFPGVYTSVINFVPWVQKQIKKSLDASKNFRY